MSDKLPDNCKDTDCVIFNSNVDYKSNDNISINPKNIKCIPKINGSCLPDFNIITDQKLGNCPYNSVHLGDSVPISINGSSLDELCLSKQFNILSEQNNNCKNLFTGDNIEGRCPWIGYNLFDHGDKKGVDGTYTFITNDEKNPYWCFDDECENKATNLLKPEQGQQSWQTCHSKNNKTDCENSYYQWSKNDITPEPGDGNFYACVFKNGQCITPKENSPKCVMKGDTCCYNTTPQ